MQTLADRLAQPDMQPLADWQAADKLNAPDASLPAIVEWEKTALGYGSILVALGAARGAAVLSQIEAGAASNPVFKWGLEILRQSSFDLSLPVTRDTANGLVMASIITADERDKFFALSKRQRYPSWAEANDMIGKVTARSVGIARGGEP